MTSTTIKFLLNKLPKGTLIDTIVMTYEALFTDPAELKEAYRELAGWIQAREIILGTKSVMDFKKPFRDLVQKNVIELQRSTQSLQKVKT